MASFPRAEVEELIHEIQQKIEHWNLVGHAEECAARDARDARARVASRASLGARARARPPPPVAFFASRARGARRYEDLELREAYLQQVSDADRNRFGGGMGPYAAHLVAVPGVEYINASPIDHLGGEREHRYIATMCPKANTTADFWAMVWHARARVVVNLTHARDRLGSSPLDKRERYWPPFSAPSCAAQTEPGGGGRRVPWPVRVQTLAAEAAAGDFAGAAAPATLVRKRAASASRVGEEAQAPSLPHPQVRYTVRLVERASNATRDVRLYVDHRSRRFSESENLPQVHRRDRRLRARRPRRARDRAARRDARARGPRAVYAIGACRKAGHRQGARALAAEMQRKGLGRSSAPEPAGV